MSELRRFFSEVLILDSLKGYRGLTSDTPVVSEHFREALKAGKKLFK